MINKFFQLNFKPMKKFINLFLLVSIFNHKIKIINKKNKKLKFNGIYRINTLSKDNNNYISIYKNSLIISNLTTGFNIIPENSYYYLESKGLRLGIGETNLIILYNKKNKTKKNQIIDSKLKWNIIKINKNKYLIKNHFTNNFIESNKNSLQCINKPNFSLFLKNKNKNLNKNFIFSFLKLYEKLKFKKYHLKYIEKENIDLVIKYIDLKDKNINRSKIKQIYKDQDNEELKYSIRSVLQYIPWIRKIFIIMPNERVRYFKSIKEIEKKIRYIKDKDLLGYDTSNICAFTFSLYRLKKFNLSKNFIYMDDDYFIGKPLKKSDFFYYDENEKKVFPLIINTSFREINKTEVYKEYNKLFDMKEIIFSHSSIGFRLSLLCTEKFFIEHYNNITLITAEFTHNAIPENLDELKEIYKEFKKYKYYKETMQSKLRYILRLNHQHFVNLYQLNVKNRKVKSLPHRYVRMEIIKKVNLNKELFVINTGGNHFPLKREYKIQKRIMNKRFPQPTQYEIEIEKREYYYIYFLWSFIITTSIKIFILKIFKKY